MVKKSMAGIPLLCVKRFVNGSGVYVKYLLRDLTGKTDVWTREQVLERQGNGYLIYNLNVSGNRISINHEYNKPHNIEVKTEELKTDEDKIKQHMGHIIGCLGLEPDWITYSSISKYVQSKTIECALGGLAAEIRYDSRDGYGILLQFASRGGTHSLTLGLNRDPSKIMDNLKGDISDTDYVNVFLGQIKNEEDEHKRVDSRTASEIGTGSIKRRSGNSKSSRDSEIKRQIRAARFIIEFLSIKNMTNMVKSNVRGALWALEDLLYNNFEDSDELLENVVHYAIEDLGYYTGTSDLIEEELKRREELLSQRAEIVKYVKGFIDTADNEDEMEHEKEVIIRFIAETGMLPYDVTSEVTYCNFW